MRKFLVLLLATLSVSCLDLAGARAPVGGEIANKMDDVAKIIGKNVDKTDDAISNALANLKAEKHKLNRNVFDMLSPAGKALKRSKSMPGRNIDDTLNAAGFKAKNLQPPKVAKLNAVKSLRRAKSMGHLEDVSGKTVAKLTEGAATALKKKPTLMGRLWTGIKWTFGIAVVLLVFAAIYGMS